MSSNRSATCTPEEREALDYMKKVDWSVKSNDRDEIMINFEEDDMGKFLDHLHAITN